MYDVYALKNDSNKIYIGHSSFLEHRIMRHNNLLKNKKSSYTSKNKHGEWALIYKEEFNTRKEAMAREKQLKSYQGREFIKTLISKNITRR